MPNWCMNNLTVTHSDPAKLQEFVDAWNSGSVCNHYLPTPRNESLQFIEDKTSPDYWYSWNISNWGTKWDFGKDEHDDVAQIVNNEVSVSFDTAWSPPIEFYNHLQKLRYMVIATYWEPGIGFCGFYENGIEDTIEYEDKEEIPDELWDQFGMEDFFEMSEEI